MALGDLLAGLVCVDVSPCDPEEQQSVLLVVGQASLSLSTVALFCRRPVKEHGRVI